MKRYNTFKCPKCRQSAHRYGSGLDYGRRCRRRCKACSFEFTTLVDDDGRETFEAEFIPTKQKGQRAKDEYLQGYETNHPGRELHLAPHQRLLDVDPYGRFGKYMESGFKLLRDPQTGKPVARDHSDLRPGEVSLVLE